METEYLENVDKSTHITGRIYLDPNATNGENDHQDYQYFGNVNLEYFKGVPFEHIVGYAGGTEYTRIEFTESLRYLSLNQLKRLGNGIQEFIKEIEGEEAG